jgi:hypothetical protein
MSLNKKNNLPIVGVFLITGDLSHITGSDSGFGSGAFAAASK